MPVFATELRVWATVYVEANDPGHAKRRVQTHLGTWDEPIEIPLSSQSLPLAEGITLDPTLTSYGSPRRATIDETALKDTP